MTAGNGSGESDTFVRDIIDPELTGGCMVVRLHIMGTCLHFTVYKPNDEIAFEAFIEPGWTTGVLFAFAAWNALKVKPWRPDYD